MITDSKKIVAAARALREGSSVRQVAQQLDITEDQVRDLARDIPGLNAAPRTNGQTAGTAGAPTPTNELPTRLLLAHPANIRTDLGNLDELAATIRQHGILQPLLITRDPERKTYVLLDGHRRLAAAQQVGLDKVPVKLHAAVDSEDATILMLVTGLQKADLHPLDEADAYRRLVDGGMTQRDIAALVGKTSPHVSSRTALSYLTPEERAAFRAKEIGVAEAYQIGRQRNSRAIKVEQRRDKPRRVPHFTPSHPLAPAAGFLCNRAGHQTTLRLGVACGSCWEAAISEHAIQKFLENEEQGAVRREALPELDLSQAPPPVLSGFSHTDVDPVAVELACGGERDMRLLTIAERREVVRVLHRQGLSDQAIARRTGCSDRTALRIRQELDLPAIQEAS